MQQGIFTGRTAVRYPYGCYGYTRGGGKRWHGGLVWNVADDMLLGGVLLTVIGLIREMIRGR